MNVETGNRVLEALTKVLKVQSQFGGKSIATSNAIDAIAAAQDAVHCER